MTDDLRESEDRAVYHTLLSSYSNPAIRQARERQDAVLVERLRGGRYKIADIGCGDGYHAALFAPACVLYHGFEISTEMAEVARAGWREKGVGHAEVFVGDVAGAKLENDFYDVVLCLYFTPGNLRDKSDDLAPYTDAYLDRNPRFIEVISRFRQAMKNGGRMFLTVYKDVPEAEEAQIDFYEHTGQHVVTARGSRFVATKENFWSVRWTDESMLSNLREAGVQEGDVVFHDLNAIAWLVEIRK